MSTTFGIVIKNGKLLDLPEESFEHGLVLPEDIKDEDNVKIETIAFRSSWGIVWQNPLAEFLPRETKVYALDNSPQGIFTIRDILSEINNQKII